MRLKNFNVDYGSKVFRSFSDISRIRIMNINLDLDVGKYRFLSNTELKKLNELTKNSSKEFN